jgi:hypothetical protein
MLSWWPDTDSDYWLNSVPIDYKIPSDCIELNNRNTAVEMFNHPEKQI